MYEWGCFENTSSMYRLSGGGLSKIMTLESLSRICKKKKIK
jgi:hypothetical protein